MYKLDKLPESARVWIYQLNKPLGEEEERKISSEINSFIEEWTAHGKKLQAGFDILFHRFIVIGVDESMIMASGCSIDTSVHFLQSLEERYDIELFDRQNVAFRTDDNIATVRLNGIKDAVSEGVIDRSTEIFNNLIQTKQEMEGSWIVPAEKTWLNRYFK